MPDSQPNLPNHTDADVPALHATGLWSRLNSRLPIPYSVRGSLRELLHGRSRPWQDIIRRSNLPAPVMQTIALTTRRTRLWQSEKSDVARELCAHFADGIEAGKAPDELSNSFGEPKAVAKLIRAAKRRGRPIWWQLWRYSFNTTAAALLLLLGVYAVLALMFFAYSPTISHNYSAEINAKILSTPESSRAWPIYFTALKDLGKVPLDLETTLEKLGEKPDPNKREDMWPQQPGDERWPLAAAWVNSKHAAIEKIRHASAMEHLGFPLRDQLPDDYRKYSEGTDTLETPSPAPEENPKLVSVLLPYLGNFRQIARVLSVDARFAAQEHDADRFVADIRAMCGMAHQCDEVDTLINKLVQVAILALAINVASEPLASDLLDAEHLRDLAHCFATFDDSVLQAPLSLERQFLYDAVQRTYSDNGSGDGHMTLEGLKLLESYSGENPATREPEKAFLIAAGGPLSVAGMASRKELLAQADRFYAMSEEEARLPLWKRDSSKVEAELLRMQSSVLERTRYRLLLELMPAMSKVAQSIEQSRQTRDGILVALAVESYRRTHGAYPATLDPLVPSFLPAIPPDRYDGNPIKCRLLTDGPAPTPPHPVIYSIGVDRIDNAGRGPKDPKIAPNTYLFKTPAAIKTLLNDPRTHDQFSGDWILYPK